MGPGRRPLPGVVAPGARAISDAEIPANGDVNIFQPGSVNYAFCAPGQKATYILEAAAQSRDKVGKEN
jgi:hypothetical protein